MTPVCLSSVSDEVAPFRCHRGKVGCVLIHGFIGTPWALKELGEYLAQRDVTVSVPLLPGHGTQPSDLIGIPWERWVEVARREVEELQEVCAEVFLLGLSMGGSIALLLSTQLVCAGLITLSAPIVLRGLRIKLVPFVRPFVRYWKRPRYLFSGPPGSSYDRYPLAAVSELKKLLKRVRRVLGRVSCPTLIIHAKGDRRVSEVNAEMICRRIGPSEKRVLFLEHPAHTVTKGEDREKVEEAVYEFIRSHSCMQE